jgi:hypothetical protein
VTGDGKLILSFTEIRVADLPLVGGKGANLADLEQDVAGLIEGFKRSKHLGLMIPNEKAGRSNSPDPA